MKALALVALLVASVPAATAEDWERTYDVAVTAWYTDPELDLVELSFAAPMTGGPGFNGHCWDTRVGANSVLYTMRSNSTTWTTWGHFEACGRDDGWPRELPVLPGGEWGLTMIADTFLYAYVAGPHDEMVGVGTGWFPWPSPDMGMVVRASIVPR